MNKQQINIPQEKCEQLSDGLLETNRNLNRYSEELIQYSGYIKTDEASVEALNDPAIARFIAHKKVNTKFLTKVKKLRDNEVASLQGLIRDSKGHIDQCERLIPKYKNAVEVHTKKLKEAEKLYPPKILHINDIKMSLVGFPNIDEGRSFFTSSGGKHFLTLYYHDVVCTPDKIAYANILDKDWVLPDSKVVFNLQTGECTVTASDVLKEFIPNAYADGKVHPHIMRNSKPCYGDFLGAVVEAKENLDIAEMATIMLLFLEQANVSDDAGTYYPRFMMAKGLVNQYGVNNISRKDRACVNNTRKMIKDRTRFYGGVGEVNGVSCYRIPIVEDGKCIVYDVFSDDTKQFLEDLKKPFDKRAANGYVAPMKKTVKKKASTPKSRKKMNSLEELAAKNADRAISVVEVDNEYHIQPIPVDDWAV